MAGLYGCFKGRNSDSAAMASGPPDATPNQEPAEAQEECSGKKKSKFQTFKKFFARKKRKEPSAAAADAALKVSQSTDNVSKASENNTLTRSEKDKGSGSKISLGGKALSHDSVFVSDSSEANEALGASQDSIHGKVKSLQLQLKQAIRLGSPPSLMCVKKAEDAGTMSEDDGLPCSPPEYTTLHTAVNQAQMNSSVSLEGIDSDDEQLSFAASSRAMSPLVVPGDFSLPASPFGCLDNSAAKHKLGLRNKACNRRKPASRLEGRVEGDSAVEEMLTTSMQEAEIEAVEEQQQRTEDVSDHQLKPKVEKEEEEDEVEETEPPQHSRRSLLRDKEEREEGEDESEAEQDVSHGPDTSCPPEPKLSEDEASEHQPLPSSKSSSRASSLDSPRATPEPPAGEREYLLDPPGIVYGAEKKFDSDSTSEEEEDGVQETMEEESSLLEEVLSSLKTPLVSLDVKTEDVFLEMKQEGEGKLKEEAKIEEGEEVKEEEEEKHQPISYQFTPSSSVLSDQATEEEEEVVTPSWQEEEEEKAEVVVVEEEVKGKEEEEEVKGREEEEVAEEEEEEAEDLAVEQFTQHGHEEETQKEDAEEVQPEEEESSMLTRQNISQAGEEGDEGEEKESEGEEEAIELEKEPEVEEEGREKTEEDDDEGVVAVEVNEGRAVEEAEEAMEEEKGDAEEVPEMLADAQEEVEVQSETSMQEADEGVVLADDAVYAAHAHDDDDEIPADLGDQGVASVQEEHEKFSQSSGDEIEDGEEIAAEEEEEEEEGEEVSVVEKNQEDRVEANQPAVDETEQDLEQESAEVTPRLDVDPSEATEQASVSSKPLSLSLPESPSETRSPESGATTPSKTSIIHINLISPSSEKATSFFQTTPTDAEPRESVAQSPHADSTEEKEMALAQEEEKKEEEKEPTQEQDATPPTSAEEAVDHQPSSSDQSKVRFTVSPAWQRSQSLSPPSSPPACASPSSVVAAPSVEEVEAANKKVELVLSPSKMRSAGSAAAKPQNSAAPSTPVKPQTSAAASTEATSAAVEGSNPFGVRLRKTSALLRLSSEEETTEPPVESPAPPTTPKADPPQPVSVKPSAYQPVSNKPVVPKKPEVHGDVGGKPKRISDPATGRGVSAGSDSPSWISMAKQKQKIYKENSLEEITVKKEEQERKSSLPMYVSSAASREQSNKTAESSSKASQSEISKPSASAEKEAKRALSPPTPVPPQPSRSQPLPGPVAPKPQVPHVGAKQPPHPNVPQRSIPPPTPVPVSQKSPSCTSPLPLSITATSPKTAPVTSPPFSSRPVPEKPGAKAAGHSGQTPSSQRGLTSPGLPQDEPPWMALAKKKAKAWSEMPQIVQ